MHLMALFRPLSLVSASQEVSLPSYILSSHFCRLLQAAWHKAKVLFYYPLLLREDQRYTFVRVKRFSSIPRLRYVLLLLLTDVANSKNPLMAEFAFIRNIYSKLFHFCVKVQQFLWNDNISLLTSLLFSFK